MKNTNWYDKNYKLILFIPIILLICCLIYLSIFYSKNNDFFLKDVSLSGGSTITLNGNIDTSQVLEKLNALYPGTSSRHLTDISTGNPIATIIEIPSSNENIKQEIESILGFELTEKNSSFEFSGPALSKSFYNELMRIVFLSFILMGLVVFFIFGESKFFKSVSLILTILALKLTFPLKTTVSILAILVLISCFAYSFIYFKKKNYLYTFLFLLILSIYIILMPNYYLIFPIFIAILSIYLSTSIPSIAIIFAAFADIIMTITIIDLFGIKISSAGLAALLMLIGYSVDTDILLTSRAIKNRQGSLNSRIYSAFKTGIFMTITALCAVLPAFFIISGLPDSFRQIFLILALGLTADIINTWMTNTGIVKWFCQKRGIN